MKTLDDIAAYLHSVKPPWLAMLPAHRWVADLVSAGPADRLLVTEIDGSRCQTKASLFEHFAECLHFPDYFGRNWDAFLDCVRDLEWIPAAGYAIVVSDANRLLRHSEKDFAIFVDILDTAAEEWAQGSADFGVPPKPFHTILLFSESA